MIKLKKPEDYDFGDYIREMEMLKPFTKTELQKMKDAKAFGKGSDMPLYSISKVFLHGKEIYVVYMNDGQHGFSQGGQEIGYTLFSSPMDWTVESYEGSENSGGEIDYEKFHEDGVEWTGNVDGGSIKNYIPDGNGWASFVGFYVI